MKDNGTEITYIEKDRAKKIAHVRVCLPGFFFLQIDLEIKIMIATQAIMPDRTVKRINP